VSNVTTAAGRPADPGPADLLYGETENELRAAVRAVLADKAAWRDVLARTETVQTYDDALWRTLAADVGCAGLLVPESAGGAGATYREAAVVAEELGRTAAPVPFLGSSVVATTALLAAGAGAGGLLTDVASGAVTAVLAVPFAAAPSRGAAASGQGSAASGQGSAASGQGSAASGRGSAGVRLVGPRRGDAPGVHRLSGTVSGVADALPAEVLLVPADGVPFGLYEVRVGAEGVSKAPFASLDMTRQLCDLHLDGALARQIASGQQASRAVDAALLAGAGTLAAELLGVAEQCLDMTVAYVKERRQFARQIGSFQAIKHRLADLWVAVTLARAAARSAAAALAGLTDVAGASGPAATEVALAVALAKAACSDTAVRAAEEMVQLHGGIGFTWEHPAHLYLKRAKADSIGFGTADAHRASLATLANLPPATDVG
jgi:alkylation response protein AidB-like acyl-CoA dehydrogenase